MARLILKGGGEQYLSWAKTKLSQLKAGMSRFDKRTDFKVYDLPDAKVSVASYFGHDLITIEGFGGQAIIICYIGSTTGDFSSKRFYDLSGNEIARDEVGYTGPLPKVPAGWILTDDGLYGPNPASLDPTDPFNNTFAWNPGGLGIPSNGSGVASKLQAGRTGRYILNGAIEDETFQGYTWEVIKAGGGGYDYTYQFVRQVDSLTWVPYAIYGPRPYFTKYLGDKVLTMIVPWASSGSTLLWDAYQDVNFVDVLPKVHKLWTVNKDKSRVGTDITDYGDTNDAVIGACGYQSGNDLMANIVRANTHLFGTSLMAEPIRTEVYDVTTGTMVPGTVLHRCADPANSDCYFQDANTDSGYPDTASTIASDVILPHAIDETGLLAYVRVRKSGNFDSVNTGIYCGGELVEESGWEAVIKSNPTDMFGPVLIQGTRYRIIHTHLEKGFNVVVYSKTVYVAHSDQLIGYTANNPTAGGQCQVRKTMIQSLTSYHTAVNGVITDLGYSNYRREYRLTVSPTLYVGAPLPAVDTHIVPIPWVDCGYDDAGTLLVEDNSVVMRCYTNIAKGQLLLGFDVFPVAYRHNLVYDAHNNLTLTFDTGVVAYPPASDAVYATVKDRKWLLFDGSGIQIREIMPPQKVGGGHVNRINGLAFMGA